MPTNVNYRSCICFLTQSRVSTTLNSPWTCPSCLCVCVCVCVCGGGFQLLHNMVMEVQIENIYISHWNNSLGKRMNPARRKILNLRV